MSDELLFGGVFLLVLAGFALAFLVTVRLDQEARAPADDAQRYGHVHARYSMALKAETLNRPTHVCKGFMGRSMFNT